MGPVLKAKLQALQAKHPCITDVRGRGLLLGFELAPEIPVKGVWSRLLQAGFVTGTANHNTLRLLPSFLITEGEMDALCAALDNLLGGGK
jgi:acetylornithine/succinyldiaminopimelate/putrescine aminotransferase